MKKTSAKNELILSALLSNPSITAAASACGVSKRVIYDRLNDPDFRAAYDKARRDLLQQSAAAVQYHMNTAIETLAEIVGDTSASPQTRLNAAESIIRNTLKLTERADILERLEALERLHK